MSARDNPFELMERMFDRMRRQFDEASRSWEIDADAWSDPGRGTMGIDLADRGEEFVVTADLPGFEADEVDLRIVDGALQIAAERERTEEEQEGTYIRNERRRTSMRERVQLPEPVDEEGVDATLTNGVLTVTIPKASPESGGRQIEIQ